MSRSHKARYGRTCAFWKDTMLESKCQKKALAKRKRRTSRAERRTGKTPSKVSRFKGKPLTGYETGILEPVAGEHMVLIAPDGARTKVPL